MTFFENQQEQQICCLSQIHIQRTTHTTQHWLPLAFPPLWVISMTLLLAQRIFELLNCKIVVTEKQKNTADAVFHAWNRAFRNSFSKKFLGFRFPTGKKINLYIPTQDILQVYDNCLSPFNILRNSSYLFSIIIFLHIIIICLVSCS